MCVCGGGGGGRDLLQDCMGDNSGRGGGTWIFKGDRTLDDTMDRLNNMIESCSILNTILRNLINRGV